MKRMNRINRDVDEDEAMLRGILEASTIFGCHLGSKFQGSWLQAGGSERSNWAQGEDFEWKFIELGRILS